MGKVEVANVFTEVVFKGEILTGIKLRIDLTSLRS